jgi:hypothetical protein
LFRSIFRLQLNEKQKFLAAERHVKVAFELVDVHNWNYPEAEFDVVVEIFTQFSSPAERALKWSSMKRSLKSGETDVLEQAADLVLKITLDLDQQRKGVPNAASREFERCLLRPGFDYPCSTQRV